jgi:hypothetical protein
MYKIGFEIECISSVTRDKLRARARALGKKYGIKLSIIGDCTIRKTAARPHAHEIITPPLPEGDAISLLSDLYEFCKNNDCVSNPSTGLHVNVSFDEKLLNKWINPADVLVQVDYDRILKKWGRQNNLYSRSFSYYFKYIKRKFDRNWKPNNWSDPYIVRGLSKDEAYSEALYKFVTAVYAGNPFLVDSYTEYAYNNYDDKHICINLNYLKTRGYIEFRMIGGTKYLKDFDSVRDDVEHILDGMRLTLNDRS